jgi:hypothetical protein
MNASCFISSALGPYGLNLLLAPKWLFSSKPLGVIRFLTLNYVFLDLDIDFLDLVLILVLDRET